MGCGGSKDEKEKPTTTEAPKQPAAAKKTAETKPAEAVEQKPWHSDELKATMNDYFTRYDLDGSGTINSMEELKQLCTNLVVKLELDMDVASIDTKVEKARNLVEKDDGKSFVFEAFKDWFIPEFEAPSNWKVGDQSDSDDEPTDGGAWLRCGTYDMTMFDDGGAKLCEWPFKLRLADGSSTELLNRVSNDESLGLTASGAHAGLHNIAGSIDNTKKTISIKKSYDVDMNKATKEPIFMFNGEMDGVHTKVKGTWKDEETDPAADAVRSKLGITSKSGSFTMVKKVKNED